MGILLGGSAPHSTKGETWGRWGRWTESRRGGADDAKDPARLILEAVTRSERRRAMGAGSDIVTESADFRRGHRLAAILAPRDGGAGARPAC